MIKIPESIAERCGGEIGVISVRFITSFITAFLYR